ncbi:MAG: hypothetical protein PHI86_00370 [Candidatus Omnitrophica bacterium]|nr:hypothetical protein [Candidatus Omnitrophota bacterium]HOX54823.1 hypothetical protein [Candidatus Omnitrophota bacterium]
MERIYREDKLLFKTIRFIYVAIFFIVLGVFFYLIITPIGLMMKFLGKDPLDRKWDKEKKSYWIRLEQ